MTIINDILEQIENVSVSTDQNDEPSNSHGERRRRESFVDDVGQPNIAFDASEEDGDAERSNVGESDGMELQAVQGIKEKIISLYTPEDAVVRVFMVHGSQKSALALAPFALGFQQQVSYMK